jgi:hypothetical protein
MATTPFLSSSQYINRQSGLSFSFFGLSFSFFSPRFSVQYSTFSELDSNEVPFQHFHFRKQQTARFKLLCGEPIDIDAPAERVP